MDLCVPRRISTCITMGAEEYVINFAQMMQAAGNFIVLRDFSENFK